MRPRSSPTFTSKITATTISLGAATCSICGRVSRDRIPNVIVVTAFQVSARPSSRILTTASMTFCSISESGRLDGAGWPLPPSMRSSIAKAIDGLISTAPSSSAVLMLMA